MLLLLMMLLLVPLLILFIAGLVDVVDFAAGADIVGIVDADAAAASCYCHHCG